MLDIHKSTCFFVRCACKSIFILVFLAVGSIHAFEFQDGLESLPQPCEHAWVMRYFNCLTDDATIEEVVDFLVSLRTTLEAKGHQVPRLADLCLNTRDYLIEQGLKINDDDIEEIYNEIIKREEALMLPSYSHSINHFSKIKFFETKKHHKKKNKELKVSNGFAKGFMKALGGGLLCIIPHPATIAIGTALAADGIRDMIEHVSDHSSDEGDIEEKLKSLPPPAQYSNP